MTIFGILIFAILAVVGGCQEQTAPNPPAPAPTPPPLPAPSPTPTPAPLPEPEPEVLHYEIKLVSFSGVREGAGTGHTQLFFAGEVRNDSSVALQGVQVVITSYDKNDDIVAVDKWHTFYWVIEPRETVDFSLRITDYISAVRYEVSFELFEPGTLNLSVKSGVSTEILIPE